ncbi:MAG: tetratricopeptide repeat protein [Caldilineaceae bacterium]
MKHFLFSVFAKSDQLFLLQLADADGHLLGQRELLKSEVQRFVEEVEQTYHAYSPSLTDLGQRLYDWLDGNNQRWLTNLLSQTGSEGCALYIDVTEQLRHLPWELLAVHGQFLCVNPVRPITPVRFVCHERRPLVRANRPLRVLFMASSPENLHPVLNFEAEEREILEKVRGKQIEFVVVETGSLAGLKQVLESHEVGHFDVVHLSGHTELRDGQPRFLMEDDFGQTQPVGSNELARALVPHAPALVFFSSCLTGQSPNRGALPSLSEALVQAGLPVVLGWALPVYDTSATAATAALYRELALGKRIDDSVARTRIHLFENEFPDWHYLRLYSNATPLAELVTPTTTPQRERLSVRTADAEFLDAGAKVEVCPRTKFVGRRRTIQRCLRVLHSVEGDEHYYEGILIHSIAGMGKSSLAARLCERMPGHRRVVLVGAISEAELIRTFYDRLGDLGSLDLLFDNRLDLRQRMRRLFQTVLRLHSTLIVFDDFEHNLELDQSGRPIVKPAALTILTAILHAIRETGSESRVIVTSRYQFSLPSPIELYTESVESLRGVDLTKLMDNLRNLKQVESNMQNLYVQAVEMAGGNPRLLSQLDRMLADPQVMMEQFAETLFQAVQDFRQESYLPNLLELVPTAGRRLLALLSLFHIPLESPVLHQLTRQFGIDAQIDRLVAHGLIEQSRDLHNDESRYFVSSLLHPLVIEELTAAEKRQIANYAASLLFEGWQHNPREIPHDIDLLSEIHRLALIGGERQVGLATCNILSNYMTIRSNYRGAETLCRGTISNLGEDFRVLHNLARTQKELGETDLARQNYERALLALPEHDDRDGTVTAALRAAILHNLGALVAQQGDNQRALTLLHESLELLEKIGDIRGKASIQHSLAGLYAQTGNIKGALTLWQEAIEFNERKGDLQGKAAVLYKMAGVIAQQGDAQRALALLQQALTHYKQCEDAQGEATTISLIAHITAQQGEVTRALELWQQSLSLSEQVGDVRSKAGTLHNMASVLAEQGDVQRAIELWKQSLTIKQQIGDIPGKAATLSMMAGVMAKQGDTRSTIDLWQGALLIYEQLDDVHGRATVLSMMAGEIAKQGNTRRAFELWHESLQLKEQIGDIQGRAATLSKMAKVTAEQGDYAQARHWWEQSLTLVEQSGDARGRAATLANLAWLAQQEAQANEAYRLYMEAATYFATLQAWPDLLTVLDNLGTAVPEQSLRFYAQAYWLALHTPVPIEQALFLAAKLTSCVERTVAPLLAVTASYLVNRLSTAHPQREALLQFCVDLLVNSADALGIDEKEFATWFNKEGFDKPERVLPTLRTRLCQMIAGQWVFDHTVLVTGKDRDLSL